MPRCLDAWWGRSDADTRDRSLLSRDKGARVFGVSRSYGRHGNARGWRGGLHHQRRAERGDPGIDHDRCQRSIGPLFGSLCRGRRGAVEHRSVACSQRAQHRVQHERIRRAREEEGVHQIVVQPICSLETLEVIGVESLSRFKGPLKRSPHLWFAEAEELGLGHALELAAIRKAFVWFEHLRAPLYLSINASLATATSDDLLVSSLRLPRTGSSSRSQNTRRSVTMCS